MELDPNVWYEAHESCNGTGCDECDNGLVAHGHQRTPTDLEPVDDGDEVARAIAKEDNMKASMKWLAQSAGYFRDQLLDAGFTDRGAEKMCDTWLQETWEREADNRFLEDELEDDE